MTQPLHGVWHCTNAEYHADRTAVSFSTLREFAESPAAFGERTERVGATKQQDLGSLVHAIVLEPGKVGELVHRIEKRPGDETKAMAAIREVAGDRMVVDDEMEATALAMARNLVASEVFRLLLDGRTWIAEEALRWVDPIGLGLKCKPDIWIPDERIAVDIKTIGQIDLSLPALARRCGVFDYHAQAGLYLDGVRAVRGVEAAFVHVFVSSKYPHEVQAILLDDEAIEAGRALYQRWARDLMKCRADGEWKRNANVMPTVSLPPWKLKEIA